MSKSKYSIGMIVYIDYHNGRKPLAAKVVCEDMGHYFAQHAKCPHIQLDITACDEDTSPCAPTVILSK